MGKSLKDGEELRQWSKSVSDKLKKEKAETTWPEVGTWYSQNIEETEKWLNMKKEEGTGKIKLKRQLRASMMVKWRKYRNMWKIEVGRLMRETVEAMGLECVTIMEKYGLEIILGRLMGNQSSMKKRSGTCYNHAWGPRN